ncbi:MAG: hypothetical protein RSA29_14815 [Clostridium sp.]
MKKFFVILLVVAISLFVVACGGDSTKESSGTASKNEIFSVVELNTVQGVCEYYLNGLEVTPRIEPSTITGNYSHYEVKSNGNIYIDVIMDVKNLNNEAKMADDILTAKIKINSNEYTCFSVAESDDGSDLEKDASIKSQERRQIHYVAEVPKTEATGKIEIILTINGKDFSNEFHLEDIKPTDPSVESSAGKEPEGDNIKTDIQEDTKQDGTEDEYYIIIKKDWQRQLDYINSIDDPTVKQSVQTPESAAIMESNRLLIEYPGDYEAIDASLKRVLNGE